MKRPHTITFLTLVYCYALGREVLSAGLLTSNPDYALYAETGQTWFFFLLAPPDLLLEAASLWYLRDPSPRGYRVIMAGLVVGLFRQLSLLAVAANHADVFEKVLVASRQARGLSVRQEALDLMVSPAGLGLAVGFSVATAVTLAGLTFWKRDYFVLADDGDEVA